MTADPDQPAIEDRIVGSLTPGLDWVALVRAYPLASVAVAASVGFLIGRARGREILGILGDLAGERVDESVRSVLIR
ncbi:MAG: hypothetical protein OYL92_05880 [Acidobacteriota bacterium]|nr:hypothetical protein [Acidobacteriota bacterium]MDE2923607.1 hypothetical protein [Acidobacteriota bacterium]MDE3264487.1 hypothetical protein [Acidobacteriota bacterium]